MKNQIKRFAPWLMTAVIFYYLFQAVPPLEVLRTISAANIPLFIFYTVAYFVIMLFVDGVGLKWAISRFSTRISFAETLIMRGATYLLMLVNYNLGQGGMAFYLQRTHKAPLFRTLGTVFLITVIDLSIVIFVAVVASLQTNVIYRGVNLSAVVLNLGLVYFALLSVWLVFWHFVDRPFTKKMVEWKPLAWLISRHLFFAFKDAGWKDYLKITAYRIPPLSLVIFSFLLWSHAFRTPLPLFVALLNTPFILIVGTLPLTPGGVGAVQALCIELFRDYTRGPLIESGQFTPDQILFSASLLWGIGNALCKVIFGLYCFHKKSRSLFEKIL